MSLARVLLPKALLNEWSCCL